MSLYLITGGAGFIGSHLCETLLARGDSVRVLDDLSSGRQEDLPRQVELVVGDVADSAVVGRAVTGIAGCFHLAAVASVERSRTDWLGTNHTNLRGIITVFDAIRQLPATVPVVYASSAAVYGDAASAPIAEHEPRHPLSAYGADKCATEFHAGVASHVHGIPTVGLRFFNVYGPRQDPHSPYSGVISIFCEKLRRGEPVEIFGDGAQTRDFIFVTDAVTALLAAMNLRPSNAALFNVCTGIPTSVTDLVTIIGNLAEASPKIRRRPQRVGDIRHSTGSPVQSRTALCLPDPVPLKDGLAKVLEWLARSR